ncbi:MAG TPA: YggT family protein [Nocardioidaceae bacterium]|nr:YggT family protein [Nocardioidaceae bacterium]
MVSAVASIIYLILWLFLALMFVRFIVDWVQVFARSWTPTGPILVVLEIIYTITDPPILFFRKFIPPLRLGSVALDLSFMIVLIICYLLLILVRGFM